MYTHPVDVQNVNIIRPKLLQRRLDRQEHRFEVVARIVDLLTNLGCRAFEVGCILWSRVCISLSTHVARSESTVVPAAYSTIATGLVLYNA